MSDTVSIKMFDFVINKTKQEYIKMDEVNSLDDIDRAQDTLFDRGIWDVGDHIIHTLRHGNFVPYSSYIDLSHLITSNTKKLSEPQNKPATNETNDYIVNKTQNCYVVLKSENSKDIIDRTHEFLCKNCSWKTDDFVVHVKRPVGYVPPNIYTDITYVLNSKLFDEKKE
ncbi:hypothetical protein QJ857_gp0034 [Tupanvirus soda lake]|uniref:Uncharacterized protein n=1 Tax=Tupanvirus deep ocean TaxID=2126984 RepID=A0AC59HBW9_9VIRU|nr:hypothetical protein QJ857_gp0034 [Tupanvirus soda lake]AUL77503.2 hypothetical protein [Tupanvirus soda lake]